MNGTGGLEGVSLVFRPNLTQNIVKGKRNQRPTSRRDIQSEQAIEIKIQSIIMIYFIIKLLGIAA